MLLFCGVGVGVGVEPFLETSVGSSQMWDNDLIEGGPSEMSSDAELYQLWLNLPPRSKMVEPSIQLVSPSQAERQSGGGFAPGASGAAAAAVEGGDAGAAAEAAAETVSVVPLLSVQPRTEGNAGVTVRVLAGSSVHGAASDTRTHSPVAICHATLAPGGKWALPLPPSHTALVYVRKVRTAHTQRPHTRARRAAAADLAEIHPSSLNSPLCSLDGASGSLLGVQTGPHACRFSCFCVWCTACFCLGYTWWIGHAPPPRGPSRCSGPGARAASWRRTSWRTWPRAS